MSQITGAEARTYADDMGFSICDDCGTTFIPAPGFVNDGHQCNDDGTKDEYRL